MLVKAVVSQVQVWDRRHRVAKSCRQGALLLSKADATGRLLNIELKQHCSTGLQGHEWQWRKARRSRSPQRPVGPPCPAIL